MLGEPKQQRRTGAAAGAAAGLAAAFNTPLAAITFVLEEIIGDLNSRLLGSVLLASVLGAFMVHGFIGEQPAFTLRHAEGPSYQGYALIPLVALLASLVGVQFQRSCLRLRQWTQRWRGGGSWTLPAAGAFITWLLAVAVFAATDGGPGNVRGHLGVFGLGYDDLSAALDGRLYWRVGLLLLLAKFAATVACYGTGGCGGIFSPTLFFGGMTGLAVTGALSGVAD